MVAFRRPPTPGKESMEKRKVTYVPLKQINVGDRYFRMQQHTEPVAVMAEDIKKRGLQFAILLGPDMELIDGMYRVMAFESMGETELPAFIAETFADAIDYLAEMNEGINISYSRIGEIIMALRPLMLKDAAIERARGRWRATEPPRRHGRARDAYAHAFHHKSNVMVGRIKDIYMSAEVADNPKAKELVKQLEAGLLTPHTAYAKLHRRPFFKGNVSTRSQQESLLRNSALSLGAVVAGLMKLQSPLKVRPEVAKECLDDLRKARATLISAIRELEKETEQA